MDFEEKTPESGLGFLRPLDAQLRGVQAGSGRFAGLNLYSWIEQSYGPNGAYTEAAPARQGTFSNSFALERNNRIVPVPSFVELRMRGLVDGMPIYEFDTGAALHFVRMTQDAVSESHPEYVGAVMNAVVQKRLGSEWADDLIQLHVTTLDSLKGPLNAFASNGRLPLRKGDRFWVVLHESGKWVPTYEPRSAGVRVEDKPRTIDGLFQGFARYFDDTLVKEFDNDACLIYDPNGLGLEPGIYAGADLIGHRAGKCIYRVTCCAHFASGSSSGSSSGSLPGSGAISGSFDCSCISYSCGTCPAGAISSFWELDIDLALTDPASKCFAFQGHFLLIYVGGCTWQTASFVDLRPSGPYGPTWRLVHTSTDRWLLFAAGAQIPVDGIELIPGCNSPLEFITAGWEYGAGHAGCDIPSHLISVFPLCPCPSGSGHSGSGVSGSMPGSICAPKLCSLCVASPCVFAINLAGFGSDAGCPASCDDTPESFEFFASGFTGCLAVFNGIWDVPFHAGCDWLQVREGGTSTAHFHTSGSNLLTLSLSGPGPVFPAIAYTGLIPDKDCCDAITLHLVKGSDSWTGACTAATTFPETIVVAPHCSPGVSDTCNDFNAGLLVLTNDSDCSWTGSVGAVLGNLVFNGVSWLLSLEAGTQTIVYRALDTNCCGPGDVFLLDQSDCAAPSSLPITAASPCDNCCPSGSGSGSGGGTGICDTGCGPCVDTPMPHQFRVRMNGFVNSGLCSDCDVLNREYLFNYVGSCLWVTEDFDFCGSVGATHWALHQGGVGWRIDGPSDLGFECSVADFPCCGSTNGFLATPDSGIGCDGTTAVITLFEPVGGCEGVCTGCGTESIPETVFATITAGDPCMLAGPAIPIMWDGTVWHGEGNFGTCGRRIIIKLRCNAGTWEIAAEFPDDGGCDTGHGVDGVTGVPGGVDVWFSTGSSTLPTSTSLSPLDPGCGAGGTVFDIQVMTG